MSETRAARGHSGSNAAIIAILMIIGVAAGLLVLTPGYSGFGAVEYSATVVDAPVAVNANSYNTTRFTVPAGARDIILQGTVATSGTGNSVTVYVISSVDFNSWLNGQQVNPFYRSEGVSMADVSVRLPNVGTSTYYVVFKNNSPSSSRETVTARLNLIYSREEA